MGRSLILGVALEMRKAMQAGVRPRVRTGKPRVVGVAADEARE
jgi:hypothetical protein